MKSVIYTALVLSVVNAAGGLSKMVTNGDPCDKESMCAKLDACCGTAKEAEGGAEVIVCYTKDEADFTITETEKSYTGFACLPEDKAIQTAVSMASLAIAVYMCV